MEENEQLEQLERKIFKTFSGKVKTKDRWRGKTNNQLEALYDEPKITTYVYSNAKIRWLEHIEELDNAIMRKMAN